jgi:hypothetical protein
MSYAWHAQK